MTGKDVGVGAAVLGDAEEDDPVDDPEHVLVVEKDGVDALDLAVPLDVDLVGVVDHDLAGLVVGQILLERAQPQRLVEHVGDERRHVLVGAPDALVGRNYLQNFKAGFDHLPDDAGFGVETPIAHREQRAHSLEQIQLALDDHFIQIVNRFARDF